jgi:hypothetical protein
VDAEFERTWKAKSRSERRKFAGFARASPDCAFRHAADVQSNVDDYAQSNVDDWLQRG